MTAATLALVPDADLVDVDVEADRIAWLKERRNGLGGTDAAALLGVHTSLTIASARDVTPADVFLDKTSTAEPAEDDKAIFALGHAAEPYLLGLVRERWGVDVQPGGMYRNKTEPFRYANPDGLTDNRGLVECKTVSNRGANVGTWLAGGVTDHAYVQGQHYLAVTGLEHVYYAVGVRNDFSGWDNVPRHLWTEPWFMDMAFKDYILVGPVVRNEQTIEALLEAEREFWDAVVSGVMPDDVAAQVNPSALYREAVPELDADALVPQLTQDDLDRLAVVKAEQKLLAAERDRIEDRLRSAIGSAEYLRVDGARRVRWQNVVAGKFDTKAFKADHPDLYAEYVRRSSSRRLSVLEAGS